MAVGLALAGAVVAAPAGTQQDVYLELRGRAARPVSLALPPLTALGGGGEEAAELHAVLWDDLHHSMVFDLMPPERYPAGADAARPDWSRWRPLGLQALLGGLVRRAGDGLLVEFRLYDVASGRQVIGKRYDGTAGRLRRIAHDFADEAVLHYTGVRGVASTQIAFVSDREGPKEIFVMDYDGHNQRRITYDGFMSLAPAFSPRADRIAYVAYRTQSDVPDPDVYMLLRGGGAPRPVTAVPGLDTAPAWSPDGEWLAFSSARHGNPEIYVVRPDGSDLRRLTHSPAIDTSPCWSPNGRQIAFVSNRSGIQQLYVMDRDGANVRRLAGAGSQVDDPTWNPVSPDLIAYTASSGGNNLDIFVYDLRAGQAIRLTFGPDRDEAPTWSPDGRQIAFESTRDGRTQIQAMGIDGSRRRTLTEVGNNMSPTWGGRP